MGEGTARSISGAATATADTGDGFLLSVNVCAVGDAATITVRTGGAAGTVICKLGAGIGLSASRRYTSGIPYSNLHVTITGTAPVWDVEVG
jgi:hypothetical protein